VLATANHYLLDVLAGTAVTAISVVVVEVGPQAVKRARSYQRSWT
jgi:hypothetical protein